MRLVLVGATFAFAAYAALTNVTYLKNGGYAADLPEHRRIDVWSPAQCEAMVAQAERTLGPDHGIACESVPRVRHWANLVRDAYDRKQMVNIAGNLLRSQAIARDAGFDTAR